jgi:hypothetical protein
LIVELIVMEAENAKNLKQINIQEKEEIKHFMK